MKCFAHDPGYFLKSPFGSLGVLCCGLANPQEASRSRPRSSHFERHSRARSCHPDGPHARPCKRIWSRAFEVQNTHQLSVGNHRNSQFAPDLGVDDNFYRSKWRLREIVNQQCFSHQRYPCRYALASRDPLDLGPLEFWSASIKAFQTENTSVRLRSEEHTSELQ